MDGMISKFVLRASRESISFKVFLLSFGMFNLGVNSEKFLRASRESISCKVYKLISFSSSLSSSIGWGSGIPKTKLVSIF